MGDAYSDAMARNNSYSTGIKQRHITEELIKQDVEKIYRDIERYIKKYPHYIDIPDDLVELKHYLQEHFIFK